MAGIRWFLLWSNHVKNHRQIYRWASRESGTEPAHCPWMVQRNTSSWRPASGAVVRSCKRENPYDKERTNSTFHAEFSKDSYYEPLSA